ncbi:uncharacterized protein LOC126083125 [Elephas maximus indicus]|uniref:uncharacterized protein LOC126083125 n=1 Tax=Elephas maximus indicus TaxID=99487 RepID=UPI00211700A7|nr:uncharacterized protein LOC126083125 [Elephas maximus indicus]
MLLRGGDASEIPTGAFRAFPQLHLLSVTHTHISALANLTFAGAQGGGLRSLDIGHNRLRSCEVEVAAFGGLGALEELILVANALDAWEEAWLQGTPQLQRLLLSGNRLAHLGPGAFQRAPRLQELSLAANRLSCLSTNVLLGLPDLARLDVSDNKLLVIEQGALLPLGALSELRLAGNRLTALPSLPGALATLTLWGNPWACGCPLVTALRLLGPRVQEPGRVLCHSPSPLLGQRVLSVGTVCLASADTRLWSKPAHLSGLYGFLGGLLAALLLGLFGSCVWRHWKLGLTTVPLDASQAATGRPLGSHWECLSRALPAPLPLSLGKERKAEEQGSSPLRGAGILLPMGSGSGEWREDQESHPAQRLPVPAGQPGPQGPGPEHVGLGRQSSELPSSLGTPGGPPETASGPMARCHSTPLLASTTQDDGRQNDSEPQGVGLAPGKLDADQGVPGWERGFEAQGDEKAPCAPMWMSAPWSHSALTVSAAPLDRDPGLSTSSLGRHQGKGFTCYGPTALDQSRNRPGVGSPPRPASELEGGSEPPTPPSVLDTGSRWPEGPGPQDGAGEGAVAEAGNKCGAPEVSEFCDPNCLDSEGAAGRGNRRAVLQRTALEHPWTNHTSCSDNSCPGLGATQVLERPGSSLGPPSDTDLCGQDPAEDSRDEASTSLGDGADPENKLKGRGQTAHPLSAGGASGWRPCSGVSPSPTLLPLSPAALNITGAEGGCGRPQRVFRSVFRLPITGPERQGQVLPLAPALGGPGQAPSDSDRQDSLQALYSKLPVGRARGRARVLHLEQLAPAALELSVLSNLHFCQIPQALGSLRSPQALGSLFSQDAAPKAALEHE